MLNQWFYAHRADLPKGVSVRASSRSDASVDAATTFATARESALRALRGDVAAVQPESPSRHFATEVRAASAPIFNCHRLCSARCHDGDAYAPGAGSLPAASIWKLRWPVRQAWLLIAHAATR